MRASRVLQKCLSNSLGGIHKARARVLLRAVEALISGRRLTLIDVARSWPEKRKTGSGSEVSPRIHAGARVCSSTSAGNLRNRLSHCAVCSIGHGLTSASRPMRTSE